MDPVDPDEARRRLLEELGKGEYSQDEGFIPWLLGVIERWLESLLEGIGGSQGAQLALGLVVVLAIAAIVVLVLRRTGMIRRSGSLAVATGLDAEPVRSAAELRHDARAAIDAGNHDDAAVLGLRALARDLHVRTLLDVTSGMTAHEVALAAAAPFPDVRTQLLRGATTFDTAAYSRHPVDAKRAEELVRLAEYVAEASPRLAEVGSA